MITRAIACSPGWSSARPAARSAWPSARRSGAMARRRRSSRTTASSSAIASAAAVRCSSTRSCRRNAITHRLTAPRSPTTTGKIERFHQTLRRELLDDARPFASVLAAQAAIDDWVRDYNAQRPHQSLERSRPVTPAERFQPVPEHERELLELWLPASLASVPEPQRTASDQRAVDAGAAPRVADGGPVEFDRVVPPSGNLMVCQRQFWLGPTRAGQTVRFWASVDVIHLTINGGRVKSLRSHLSTADLAQLAADGAVPAGPPPLPLDEDGAAIEVDRAVNNSGLVGLAGKQVLAAEILGGRPVIIRIEPATLMFLDPATRELLRVRPNPLTREQTLRLQGARPAGPPPRPRSEPITVQRRVSATGVITVCRQKIALGRVHAGRMVRVDVAEHTLAVELDGETRTIRRTSTRPVVVVKGSRPQRAQATSTELSASAEPAKS